MAAAPPPEDLGAGTDGVLLAEIRGLAKQVEEAFLSQDKQMRKMNHQLTSLTAMAKAAPLVVKDAAAPGSADGKSSAAVGDFSPATSLASPLGMAGNGTTGKSPSSRSAAGAGLIEESSPRLPRNGGEGITSEGTCQKSDITESEGPDSPMGDPTRSRRSGSRVQEIMSVRRSVRTTTFSGLYTGQSTIDRLRKKNQLENLIRLYDWFASLKEPPRTGLFSKLEKLGQPIFFTIIIINSFWMAYVVNDEVANPSRARPAWFMYVEVALLAAYCLELVVKLLVHRLFFFCNQDRSWNILDFCLVLYSLMDMLFLGDAVDRIAFLRALRLFKLNRLLRIFRVIHSLQQLRVILECLAGSGSKLFWSIAMMVFTFFLFSMVFVQGVGSHLTTNDNPEQYMGGDLTRAFGSAQKALLTLFQVAMGIDWVWIYDSLAVVGQPYTSIFLFFVAFCQIALLNILTGIFIESALKQSRPDGETKAKENAQEERKLSQDLKRMVQEEFKTKDFESIAVDSIATSLQGTKLGTYLHFIGVDIHEIDRYMRMHAKLTGINEISVQTFVRACLKVRGSATSLDMQRVLFELSLMRHEQIAGMEQICHGLDLGTPTHIVHRWSRASSNELDIAHIDSDML